MQLAHAVLLLSVKDHPAIFFLLAVFEKIPGPLGLGDFPQSLVRGDLGSF